MKQKNFFEENINNLDTPWATAPLSKNHKHFVVEVVMKYHMCWSLLLISMDGQSQDSLWLFSPVF